MSTEWLNLIRTVNNGGRRKGLKLHAIMVSFPLQGHIIPFVNLALKLASKGFYVTFAHLEYVHHQIIKSRLSDTTDIDIFAAARSPGLDIHYTTFSDGFPVEFDRHENLDVYLDFFLYKFPSKVDQLVKEIIQSQAKTASEFLLISDTLSVWLPEIARKYHLLSVSFWTEAALVFSLYCHRQILTENGHVPVNGRRENVDYIPGVQSINTKDFMSYFHDSELEMVHKVTFAAFDGVRSADFILCNTVEELEPDVVTALGEEHPFYTIGPLFPVGIAGNSVPTNLLPEINPTEWLNSKPKSSVLYISFGSLAKLDERVILEIACGLLLTGVNFLWVLRRGTVDYDGNQFLPEYFLQNTKGRGLITPWCTQVAVLNNPSIGGFVTHCGWNSILESVWCGVPMICYPVFTDQITNRKLVVDDWRVGINLCDGEVITRGEVAEKITMLMSGGATAHVLKQGISEKRGVLQKALGPKGSSESNFESFVLDVFHKFSLEKRYVRR